MQVVSLVPSLSETAVAWGVRPVAVTRFCEQEGVATVGGTKNPDVAAIVDLAPDLVLLDREENRREDADALQAAGLRLWVSDVRSVDDVVPTLADLRAALRLAPLDPPPEAGPTPMPYGRLRAWVPIWRRPWMTINDHTYGGSVLRACGVDNVFGGHPDPYPEVTAEDVAAARPDVTLAPSEPYPWGERHRRLLDELAPAVLVDGRDLFWWGVRTATAVDRLRVRLAALR